VQSHPQASRFLNWQYGKSYTLTFRFCFRTVLIQAWTLSGGTRNLSFTGFLKSEQMKVARLPALRTSYLYPQDIALVLISVRGWVDLIAIVQPGLSCQWISPYKPFEIVAQCLNQSLFYWVSLLILAGSYYLSPEFWIWEHFLFIPLSCMYVCMYVCIQGVTGGTDQTSGGCSLC